MACWCGIGICCAVCRLQVCSSCAGVVPQMTSLPLPFASLLFCSVIRRCIADIDSVVELIKKGASFWDVTPALLSHQFRRFEGSQCLHFEESRGLGSLDARLCDATGLSHKTSASFCLPLATRQPTLST